MTAHIATTSTTTTTLADWLSSQSYYEWMGVAGYDTRPYYVAHNGRVRLPVAHTVGFADGMETVEYGGAPNECLAIIRALHTLGCEIVVPDYSGCHRCGSTIWRPTDYAWDSFYESSGE